MNAILYSIFIHYVLLTPFRALPVWSGWPVDSPHQGHVAGLVSDMYMTAQGPLITYIVYRATSLLLLCYRKKRQGEKRKSCLA